MSITTLTVGSRHGYAGRRLDPVDARHSHVHQHDVGKEFDDLLDRVQPVVGLSHDLDVGLVLEHEQQAAAEQRVLVDEQHTYGGASSADDVDHRSLPVSRSPR